MELFSVKVVALTALIALVSLLIFNMEPKDTLSDSFEQFKSDYGKVYRDPQ
jgi:hypothetical protein